MRPSIRMPAVAGQFYEGDREGLVQQIERCYLHPLGPGDLPRVNNLREGKIGGLVVPHAGYMYSGPVAAHAYRALAADGLPEAYVIIGPNHTGFGPGVATLGMDFDTPLGVAKLDRKLYEAVTAMGVPDDLSAHRYEHSVEVQLPFLLHLGDVKFLPIVMMSQDYRTARELGAILRKAIGDRDVVVIASTDFSHYVPKEVAYKADALAIDYILSLDPRGLFDLIRRTGLSMCGYGPVMAMLETVMGSEAHLLKYATSGDVAPMYEVVGYAAIEVDR